YKGRLSSWTTYRSKKGESFATIARKFGMPVEQLRSINGLSGRQNEARSETTLIVPATPEALATLAATSPAPQPASSTRSGEIRRVSMESGSGRNASRQPGQARRNGDVQVVRRNPQAQTHVVRQGDTLFSLARRYNTTVDALRKLNNLKGNKLAVGKRLRVPGSNVRG